MPDALCRLMAAFVCQNIGLINSYGYKRSRNNNDNNNNEKSVGCKLLSNFRLFVSLTWPGVQLKNRKLKTARKKSEKSAKANKAKAHAEGERREGKRSVWEKNEIKNYLYKV